MDIQIKDLDKTHSAVQAAIEMVTAHARHDGAYHACQEVQEMFPELEPSQVILLWLGVNASNRAANGHAD